MLLIILNSAEGSLNQHIKIKHPELMKDLDLSKFEVGSKDSEEMEPESS